MDMERVIVLEFNEKINYEYRIMILEKIIARLTEDNPDLLQQNVVDAIYDEALIEMQAKYPGADIKIKEDET